MFILKISSFILLCVSQTMSRPIDLKYGSMVFLQVNNLDGLWLTGGRETDNQEVRTSDLHAELDQISSYTWTLRSVPGWGIRNFVDPKAAECVRYGDTIFLQVNNVDGRWLSGTREMSRDGVQTSGDLVEVEGRTQHSWTIRGAAGSGSLEVSSEDPSVGVCVEDLSVVYLQNRALVSKWLSGGRGTGTDEVTTDNDFQTTPSLLTSSQWILRTSRGQGARFDGISCAVIEGTGVWKSIGVQTSATGLPYEYGVTKENGFEFTKTDTWEIEAIDTVTSGFEASGTSGNITVGAPYTESQRSLVEEAVMVDALTTREISGFPTDSVVWQFVYEMTDLCETGWQIQTRGIAYTSNTDMAPCCLPGYTIDTASYHGACQAGSPCLCATEICFPPDPTPAPVPDATDDPTASPNETPTTVSPSLMPSNAPVTAPTPVGPPDLCFSEQATVQVEHVSEPVSMKHLKIGDRVLTKKQVYEPVYTFVHLNATTAASFVQIRTVGTTGSASALLELSAEHMLFVKGKKGPVRADSIRVGDLLYQVMHNGDHTSTPVTSIQRVNRNGLYGPMTPSGTLVVDRFLVSTYAGVQSRGANEFVEIGKNNYALPLLQADMIHAYMSPLRVACMRVSSNFCTRRDQRGIHKYVVFGMKLLRWGEQQHVSVQTVSLLAVLMVIGVFILVEKTLSVYGTLVLIAWAIIAYKIGQPKTVSSSTTSGK